jgi:peptide/nickel transport system ATP-binding protein
MRPRLIVADEPVSMIDASLRATVLGNLLQLNEDFGISLIYITHDLTTAYQIGDDIIVMYGGSAMEVGDIGLVVQEPKHPYTQLLIHSVPLPNPDLKWGAEGLDVTSEVKPDGQEYCKFVGRCPHAMPKCGSTVPPLYRVDEHRLVACYLYEAAPVVAAEDMVAAFVGPSKRRGRIPQAQGARQPVDANG